MMVLGMILAVFIVLLVLPVGVGVAYDDQAMARRLDFWQALSKSWCIPEKKGTS